MDITWRPVIQASSRHFQNMIGATKEAAWIADGVDATVLLRREKK
jgi:hypothetical protein